MICNKKGLPIRFEITSGQAGNYKQAPKRSRIIQRKYDKIIYRERNLVERLFGKLKQFRKIATRFEKLACSFRSLICLACVYLWIS